MSFNNVMAIGLICQLLGFAVGVYTEATADTKSIKPYLVGCASGSLCILTICAFYYFQTP